MSQQITDTILMVRPKHFGSNPETAESNAFQETELDSSPKKIKDVAREEFDAFVKQLRAAEIEVIVVEDTDSPIKPDAVFPNNWITTHDNGSIILYPMMAQNRRLERRMDIAELIHSQYRYSRLIDFSDHEAENRFLEGTGSMILDRDNRIVYACIGPRTDQSLLDEFCEWADYSKVSFRSVDRSGQDIYHTNVMMAIGTSFAVICLDSIPDQKEREMVAIHLNQSQKTIVEISFQQMEQFAGNMLQVANKWGEGVLVMSEQAYNSLNENQVETLKSHSKLLHSPIDTIEKYGGGSARCMMAEIFKPNKALE